MKRWAVLLLATVGTLPPVTGNAWAADRVGMSGAQALDVAASLVAKGRLDAAEEILRTLSSADPDRVDTLRLDVLAAEIAAARGDHARAVLILGNVLDHDPDLAEVRLRLGRSLFESGQDRRAAYHLRLARPGLDAGGRKVASALLGRIEDRRVLTARFSTAIVPDTNLNTATDQATQLIAGVEQTLNDDGALARSGVGLTTSLSLTATPRIKGPLRGEATVRGFLSDQSGIEFDFASYGAEAGPRWQGRRLTVSLLGTVEKQAFGGEAFATRTGGRLRLSAPLASRIWGSFEASLAEVDAVRDSQSGVASAASISVRRAFGRQALLGAFLTASRLEAESETQGFQRLGGGVTASREVAGGVRLTASPSYFRRRADGYSEVFAARREDETVAVSFSVAKRGFQVGGLAPQLSYGYTLNRSNVGLHDFERHRVDLGFTRLF